MFGFLKKKTDIEVYSPCLGRVIPIEDVSDEVFSQKMVGDGVGIISKDNTIYSPFDGEVVQIFDTKHAIVLKDKHENNILIHIGIDTVKLKGVPFEIAVSQGDKIGQGDIIAKVDFDLISREGLDPTVIIVLMDDSGEKVIVDKNINDDISVKDILFKVK